MRRFLPTLVLLGLPLGAPADTSLTPHKAEYDVKISVLGGKLVTELALGNNGYTATHQVRPTGMARMFARGHIRESSTFVPVDGGIRPQKYRSDDKLTSDKTQADIDFDWEAGEARGVVNDEAVVSAMDAMAFDRVSIQYELMHDLANDGPASQYVLFEVDQLKTINVREIGQRRVKVPAGEFDAIGVEHQSEGSKRVTTMWCVAELGYLPVIVEQRRKGKLKMRAVLADYSTD
ncbi:MAG: DUF3108 domain-containing protein [Pseudomonadota bacterium]